MKRLNFKRAITAVAGTLLLLTPLTSAPLALAEPGDDPLKQTVNEDEAYSTDPVTITQGHMDIGPRVIDGKFQLAVRDDSKETPVWRDPSSVVLELGQAAHLTVPENGQYDFTGAKGGQKVYVVPQSQIAQVPWLGWNTQSPEVTKLLNRGVNLTFLGAQGPGNVNVYLESGNFSKPVQLWDKRDPKPQSIWVDLNTHTHANWVFTEPGVYQLALGIAGTDTAGKVYQASTVLKFAVGVPADQARNAKWEGEVPAVPAPSAALASSGSNQPAPQAEASAEGNGTAGSNQASASAEKPAQPAATPAANQNPGGQANPAQPQPSEGGSGLNWLLIGFAGAGALVLIAGVLVYTSKSKSAREAAKAEVEAEAGSGSAEK
ncbi:hypothetical protein BSR29_07290 [Boudabousia liubingyangii]|uniref:Surface-anchored protein n=1 Tax=Boudabousia liubingyangii TaxID=1921764 RepID=A0A1Q5PK68_9ACTO|nr:choice-of-anchor M domain-containing protein [Boudabousia liubingyangii]OKL46616.1 hypothetical protein BSR29_07290 [Boudabousia liubingyangii]